MNAPTPSRREFLQTALASPVWAELSRTVRPPTTLDRQTLVSSPAAAVTLDGARAREVEVVRDWHGPLCRARVINRGRAAFALREIVLFDVPLALPPDTRLYGEGFQMLTQTGGTLECPVDYSCTPTRSTTGFPSRRVRAPSTGCSRSPRPGGPFGCWRSPRALDSADGCRFADRRSRRSRRPRGSNSAPARRGRSKSSCSRPGRIDRGCSATSRRASSLIIPAYAPRRLRPGGAPGTALARR